MSRHGFDVETWVGLVGGCNQKLVSRHIFNVATWFKGRWVATRPELDKESSCRDLTFSVATRFGSFEVATQLWCRDMVWDCLVSRHSFGVATGTRVWAPSM